MCTQETRFVPLYKGSEASSQFIGSVLGLELKAPVALLGNGQLDALATRKRDVGLCALSNHKDVVQPCGE